MANSSQPAQGLGALPVSNNLPLPNGDADPVGDPSAIIAGADDDERLHVDGNVMAEGEGTDVEGDVNTSNSENYKGITINYGANDKESDIVKDTKTAIDNIKANATGNALFNSAATDGYEIAFGNGIAALGAGGDTNAFTITDGQKKIVLGETDDMTRTLAHELTHAAIDGVKDFADPGSADSARQATAQEEAAAYTVGAMVSSKGSADTQQVYDDNLAAQKAKGLAETNDDPKDALTILSNFGIDLGITQQTVPGE